MAEKAKVKAWWLLLLVGIFLCVIGALAFIKPFHTFINLITYSGAALFLNGIFLVIVASTNTTHPKEKNWLIAEAMIDFIFGLALVFNPLFSFFAFSFLVGPWIFCIGAIKILACIVLRKVIRGWIFIFIAGLLSVGFGLLIVYNPIPKASGIITIMGAFCLVMGTLNIFDAFRFRRVTDEVVMMF